MQSYRESTVEFANFTFEREKVVCYGLLNNAGGRTTVLNFSSVQFATDFRLDFLDARNFKTYQNEAQLICMADYDRVMREAGEDARIHHRNYSRDFMMGTLAHLA